jgi:hypothetical protein
MHTMFTTAIARQIVSDRVREADTTRRARLFRGRRTTGQASGSAGTGTTERVVRRTERRPVLFQSDIIGAR